MKEKALEKLRDACVRDETAKRLFDEMAKAALYFIEVQANYALMLRRGKTPTREENLEFQKGKQAFTSTKDALSKYCETKNVRVPIFSENDVIQLFR